MVTHFCLVFKESSRGSECTGCSDQGESREPSFVDGFGADDCRDVFNDKTKIILENRSKAFLLSLHQLKALLEIWIRHIGKGAT